MSRNSRRKIRYAVVGLGHIAQHAVLPAFRHARNSELKALVTGDATKLRELGRVYGVDRLYDYEHYDACLESGVIDAVYIALPNSMHREFAVRAARAGVHVLSEKPLATSVRDCRLMIQAAADAGVKLMSAYRLHFDESNLQAIRTVESGKLGEPLFFSSFYGYQAREGNIRLDASLGGGPLFDIGIYCINAARYLFRDEPEEVFAFGSREPRDRRFGEVLPTMSVMIRFPRERIATFVCSFGSSRVSWYQIVGTQGDLRVDEPYDYESASIHHLTIRGKTRDRRFGPHDQFAPELLYFSNCILKNKEPEPSGLEGLADIRVIEGAYRSLRTGRPVTLPPLEKPVRPSLRQKISIPPVEQEGELVHAEEPSEKAA